VSRPREGEAYGRWNESKRKYILERGTVWDSSLLPVIQNLTACGATAADLGMILGYQGKDAARFIANLKSKIPDFKKAIESGLQPANALLIAHAFRSAIGYDYTEEELWYKLVQDPQNPEKLKEIPFKRKVFKKHKPGNARLLIFLAENRMPEHFKRAEQVHKSFNLSAEIPADEVRRLAGKLDDLSKEFTIIKKVESKEVEDSE